MHPFPGQGLDPVALVVEHDKARRERIVVALENLGFDVLACPGPSEPDYACVGVRTRTCPLVGGVDIVVMDVRVARGEGGQGVDGADLLALYLGLGKRCIVLAGTADQVPIDPGAKVTVLRRVNDDEFVRAIQGELSA